METKIILPIKTSELSSEASDGILTESEIFDPDFSKLRGAIIKHFLSYFENLANKAHNNMHNFMYLVLPKINFLLNLKIQIMKTKSSKVVAFMAILFIIFGVTYLDFDNLSSSGNIRPYLMLVTGAIAIIYWLIIRSK